MRIESQCGTLTGAIWPPNNDIVQVNPVRSFKQSWCSYPQGSNRAIKHPTVRTCTPCTLHPCAYVLQCSPSSARDTSISWARPNLDLSHPAWAAPHHSSTLPGVGGSWLNDLLTTEACNFKVEPFCTAELPLGMPPAAVQVSRRPNHVPVFSHFQPHRKAKKPTHLSSPLKGGVKSPQPNSWYIPVWPACLRVSTIKASTTPCI